MAFSVEAVNGISGQFTTLTRAFTVTNANLLLVGVGVGDSGLLTGVTSPPTWNGTSTTAVASSDANGSSWTACRWYKLDNPAAGTFNVVLDAISEDQASIHIISFIDANLTLNTPSVAAGSGSNPSLTVVNSASGDIVVALLVTDAEGTDTEEANTSIFDVENVGSDTDHNSQYKTATGANTAMTWTAGNDQYAMSGLAVSPSGGGGGGGASGRDLPLLGMGT